MVDDGSQDSTYEIARHMSSCVRLIRNLGIGGAVQTGIKYAARYGYDFCVQIDGDGQHPPGEVARLIDAYKQSPTNIVIGSRYIKNDTFRSTFFRRFGGKVIAASLNLLFGGTRITDPTSGMRLMDREAISYFAQHYPHDFPEPISLAWALQAGYSASEVPVEMRIREHGDSSIIGLKPFTYMVRVIGYIVLSKLNNKDLKGHS